MRHINEMELNIVFVLQAEQQLGFSEQFDSDASGTNRKSREILHSLLVMQKKTAPSALFLMVVRLLMN